MTFRLDRGSTAMILFILSAAGLAISEASWTLLRYLGHRHLRWVSLALSYGLWITAILAAAHWLSFTRALIILATVMLTSDLVTANVIGIRTGKSWHDVLLHKTKRKL